MFINCQGKLLDLSQPKVMGILNITKDSFFDGGQYLSEETIINRVQEMIEEGMDILDIGAMSSRPGAALTPVDEEIKRLINCLTIIENNFEDLIISIDTLRSEVVEALAKFNIHIINDISGGDFDDKMIQACIDQNLVYVIMHMQGLPSHMQYKPTYKDVTYEILVNLRNKVKKAQALGLKDIIIDVGFGFGKTVEHNYELLKNLSSFRIIECPILVGLSRKSMIYKVLGNSAEQALNGTTALHMTALMNGANILRVHDVKEAKEVVKLYRSLIDKKD